MLLSLIHLQEAREKVMIKHSQKLKRDLKVYNYRTKTKDKDVSSQLT